MKITKYGLHGKLKAVPGKGDELAAILAQASEMMTDAHGCHLYLVSKDSTDADTVWVTEVWDSKEAHANSLNLEGVKELISKAIPILDGRPERSSEMNVIAGI